MPKSTSHILSVPLNLECLNMEIWNLDPSFFSSTLIVCIIIMQFCVRLLSKLMIMLSTHDMTNHLACSTSCNLILKSWKCNTRDIGRCNCASIYVLIFRKLFYIYKLIHIDLKPRILIASLLLASLSISKC